MQQCWYRELFDQSTSWAEPKQSSVRGKVPGELTCSSYETSTEVLSDKANAAVCAKDWLDDCSCSVLICSKYWC